MAHLFVISSSHKNTPYTKLQIYCHYKCHVKGDNFIFAMYKTTFATENSGHASVFHTTTTRP